MMSNNIIGTPTLFQSLVKLREAEKWMQEEEAKGAGNFKPGIKNNKEVFKILMDQAVGRQPVDE